MYSFFTVKNEATRKNRVALINNINYFTASFKAFAALNPHAFEAGISIVSLVDGLIVQSILKTEHIPFKKVASFIVDKWV